MRKVKRIKRIKRKPYVPTYTSYAKWLEEQLSDIFNAAFDEDICGFENINQLAEEANLAWDTVYNLRNHYTRFPQMQTIFKLCLAIKMDINLVKEDMALRVVKFK
jgi:DNA-binding phage protein